MLETRFLPKSEPKKSKSNRKDVLFILNLSNKKVEYPDPVFVLQFVKSLEIYALKLCVDRNFDFSELKLDLSEMKEFTESSKFIQESLKSIILSLLNEDKFVSFRQSILSLLMSYIVIYRHYHIKKIASPTSSITAEYNGKKSIEQCKAKYFTASLKEEFFSKFNFDKIDLDCLKSVIYTSNKNGPSSGKADLSEFRDLLALNNDPKLFEHVKNCLRVSKMEKRL
jgi:hypothetical protein